MRLAGLILAATVAATAHAQQPIENSSHGYSIEIPSDWIAAPDEFLTKFSRAVSNASQRLRYVGAYQQAAFEDGLAYPYLLVQAIPYGDFGLDREPTTEERAQLVNEITGLDIRDAMRETASKQALELVQGAPSVDNFSYDESTGGYAYDLRMNVAEIGVVKGRIRGAYGEWALLQAAYYAKDEDWQTYEQEAEAILNSFNMVAGTPRPDYASTSASNRVVRGALRGAIGGAIIGGIIALAAAIGIGIARKRSTPKPPPL